MKLAKIVALGKELDDFTVLRHNLPLGSPVDGLLGLDFFRGRVLTVDFANGMIDLA